MRFGRGKNVEKVIEDPIKPTDIEKLQNQYSVVEKTIDNARRKTYDLAKKMGRYELTATKFEKMRTGVYADAKENGKNQAIIKKYLYTVAKLDNRINGLKAQALATKFNIYTWMLGEVELKNGLSDINSSIEDIKYGVKISPQDVANAMRETTNLVKQYSGESATWPIDKAITDVWESDQFEFDATMVGDQTIENISEQQILSLVNAESASEEFQDLYSTLKGLKVSDLESSGEKTVTPA